MIKFVTQLFCKHSYKKIASLRCTYIVTDNRTIDVPIHFYMCRKCNKRKTIKFNSVFYNYSLIEQIELWEKGELEFNDIENS